MFARKSSEKSSGSSATALPKEFYTRPELTKSEAEFLGSIATKMCLEVIVSAQENGGTVKWKHKTNNRDGVHIFQGEEFGGNDNLTYVCGVNTIRGTLADITDLFHFTSDEKLASYARVFEPDLIDMFTIYDIVTPSPENPMHYIGVRWSAIESSSPLVKNRDFCYLECQDEFVDTRTNKQGWVRCVHSINMPRCCPSMEKSFGFVRGSYYRSGVVVVETNKPGVVDITYILQVNFKGSVPAWWRQQTLRRRVASIGRIEKFLQGKKLSEGRILGDIDLPPKQHVVHCHLCSRRFDHVFTRRYRCRKCAHVICKHCSDHWYLQLPVSGEKRVRICTMCAASSLNSTANAAMMMSPKRSVRPPQFVPPRPASTFAAAPPPNPSPCHRRPTSTPNIHLMEPRACAPATHDPYRRLPDGPSRREDDNESVDSQTNHYSYDSSDNDSFQDSSVYETNPFERQLQQLQHGQEMRHPTHQSSPATSAASCPQTGHGTVPQLERRMRARGDLNESFLESVRSINLGRHGAAAVSGTDWFHAQMFGEADVSLDPLDREWSKVFGQHKAAPRHPPDYNSWTAYDRRSSGSPESVPSNALSSHASTGFRYSVQVPQHTSPPHQACP
ncbi:hypothetical protein H310_04343 [Aphanomyces invadans]|uniref:FYVE-type domain-containing protein n=1 Tax=Aphanomyces invadans TaxID=157072 RepID=A0A024UCL4_9STRA|nr:hypothetical protein H310_04343 [Aphanomyces invadans]ETW03925.1 hypothetical protein H310_04343 [Aphanomyces invadans]|eukprot:XP_008866881.1 hypothetical protein H310_04343 [Aphanomyces invadans]